MEFTDSGRCWGQEWGSVIKSVWAFAWIRMLKALIGKVTKFRKGWKRHFCRLEQFCVKEELPWGWCIPYLLNPEILACFPKYSSADHWENDEGQGRAFGEPPESSSVEVEVPGLHRLFLLVSGVLGPAPVPSCGPEEGWQRWQWDGQRWCPGWCPVFPAGAVGVEVPFAWPRNALELSLESLSLWESSWCERALWGCGMQWGREGLPVGHRALPGHGAQADPGSSYLSFCHPSPAQLLWKSASRLIWKGSKLTFCLF